MSTSKGRSIAVSVINSVSYSICFDWELLFIGCTEQIGLGIGDIAIGIFPWVLSVSSNNFTWGWFNNSNCRSLEVALWVEGWRRETINTGSETTNSQRILRWDEAIYEDGLSFSEYSWVIEVYYFLSRFVEIVSSLISVCVWGEEDSTWSIDDYYRDLIEGSKLDTFSTTDFIPFLNIWVPFYDYRVTRVVFVAFKSPDWAIDGNADISNTLIPVANKVTFVINKDRIKVKAWNLVEVFSRVHFVSLTIGILPRV